MTATRGASIPSPTATGAGRGVGARVAAAALAGATLALAYAPHDLLGGWLAIPALAALLACFHAGSRLPARVGALLGGAAGLGFHLVLLSWLRVLGPDAWVALSAVCAAVWAAAGAALPRVLASRWWLLGVPALWVTLEATLGRAPFGGFGWGRLAFSQADTPLRGWAALGGAALVSFAVALAAALLLAAVRSARRRGPLRAALPPAAGIALIVAGGAFALLPAWGGPASSSTRLAIVQGNVPRVGLDFSTQRRAVLDNHVRVTEELAAQVRAGQVEAPVAVLWPENSSDLDPLRYPDAAAAIDRAAEAIGVPILVGAVLTNPEDPATILNVSLVWDPVTGPGDRYVKRHPVPFGEYLPFRDVLTRFITRFERIPRDFAAGDEPGLLDLGGVPTSVVICFEIAYDGLVREAVAAGGGVLVVQTNNATYGLTGQPEQQLAITRIQAVAAGRTTLVAATSGISAMIDERGSVGWRTEQFTAASTVVPVDLRTGLTPAVRLGPLVEIVCLIALAGLALVEHRRRPEHGGDRDAPR